MEYQPTYMELATLDAADGGNRVQEFFRRYGVTINADGSVSMEPGARLQEMVGAIIRELKAGVN